MVVCGPQQELLVLEQEIMCAWLSWVFYFIALAFLNNMLLHAWQSGSSKRATMKMLRLWLNARNLTSSENSMECMHLPCLPKASLPSILHMPETRWMYATSLEHNILLH